MPISHRGQSWITSIAARGRGELCFTECHREFHLLYKYNNFQEASSQVLEDSFVKGSDKVEVKVYDAKNREQWLLFYYRLHSEHNLDVIHILSKDLKLLRKIDMLEAASTRGIFCPLIAVHRIDSQRRVLVGFYRTSDEECRQLRMRPDYSLRWSVINNKGGVIETGSLQLAIGGYKMPLAVTIGRAGHIIVLARSSSGMREAYNLLAYPPLKPGQTAKPLIIACDMNLQRDTSPLKPDCRDMALNHDGLSLVCAKGRSLYRIGPKP